MTPRELLQQLHTAFSFRQRPSALPGDFRPQWRLALLAIILDKFWGKKASLAHLHAVNWAIRNESARDTFLRLLQGETLPGRTIIRYEPSLNRAIDLALGEGLVRKRPADVIELTDSGRKMAAEVMQDEESLKIEKHFMEAIEGRLTQKKVNVLLSWE